MMFCGLCDECVLCNFDKNIENNVFVSQYHFRGYVLWSVESFVMNDLI